MLGTVRCTMIYSLYYSESGFRLMLDATQKNREVYKRPETVLLNSAAHRRQYKYSISICISANKHIVSEQFAGLPMTFAVEM